MSRIRILLLAPDIHPDYASMPYVTYSHAAALAELHDVTLVTGSSSEEAVRRANAPFRSIEVARMPFVERLRAWSVRRIFKYNYDTQVLTAFGYPSSLIFEWRAWQQLRHRIFAGEFDIALRVQPMTPSLPSPFAYFLRKGPIPFVIGPLNGGLPWPSGFKQLENQKEWISGLRNLYRYLPFARSTYRYAAAIIGASSQTCAEFAEHSNKLFFVPEPGISRSMCSPDSRDPTARTKIELIFVGGLVPRKACDLALRASAPLLRADLARFTVIGDGPERNRLQQLVKSLDIEQAVSFCGWLGHEEVLSRLRAADVFVFPTLRDNGAGVVFEALACGAVPVVVDFGGPGDIVYPEVGFKIPLTNENDVVSQMERVLTALVNDRELLGRLRYEGMSYARERLTWDAKATNTTEVLNWVLRQGPKPDFQPPKALTNSPLKDQAPCISTNESPKELQTNRRFKEPVAGRPLVSILIPAYNAEKWIADTLRSAIAQTWEPKEIIVVDDGSTDRTLAIARQFESEQVRVVANEHQGAAATRNLALSLSQGEYIQYLDADDLMAPDKIESQLVALGDAASKRTLLSGSWAEFVYRYHRSEFVPSALWCDLRPVDWLVRKMKLGVFMQTATWLVSRELVEAAGPWDTRLLGDDDGEYFCRVLLASDGVRFVPESKVYYRKSGVNCLSYIGLSDRKMEAQMCSMQLHIRYLCSLEDSPRVREACVAYLQNWLPFFYPIRPDLVKQAEELAASLGGKLYPPQLSWKATLFSAVFGRRQMKRAQAILVRIRWSLIQWWDKMLFQIDARKSTESV
jgi:glycosyltransferase involved in cell wall biosynthesis